jgi:hypothetical protein
LNYQLSEDEDFGMPNHQDQPHAEPGKPSIRIHLCIPDDQMRHLPKRRRAPAYLPESAPLPRQGEVIYLSSTSAWGVAMVIHEWESPDRLRVEVWLEHVGGARHSRPTGFMLTQ